MGHIVSDQFEITEGPVLVALHWLDVSSILRERDKLQHLGYLPDVRFNTVLDLALRYRGLSRSDIYVTQTFHLIPGNRSEQIPQAAIRRSFAEVTRFELEGRKVMALGNIAARECARHGVEYIAVMFFESKRERMNRADSNRAFIPAKTKDKDGAPLFKWADIDLAPRAHVEKGVQGERRSIVNDCFALAMKIDHYNATHPSEEPLQIIFNFEEDIEEMKIAKGIEHDEAA